MRHTLTLVACLFALDASAFTKRITFPNDDFAKIRIDFVDGTQLADDNECHSEAACAGRFFLVRKLKADQVRKPAKSVDVTRNTGGSILEVTLVDPVTDPSKLFLVASDLIVLKNGAPKGLDWQEYPIVPQLEQATDLEEITLQYASLTAVRFEDPKDLTKLTQSLSFTDPDDPTLRYNPYVTRVDSSSSPVHLITLGNVPRGKKIKVTMASLESVSGIAVAPDPTTIQALAFPKERKDATFYIKGSADADDITAQKKYTLDLRISPKFKFRSDTFHVAPTIDVTIGNTLAKAPNAGTAAVEFRQFFATLGQNGRLGRQSSLVVAPTFWSDRSFDNRDLGLVATWEPLIQRLEGKTLKVRRADAKRNGRLPRSVQWGFKFRPTIGAEGGRHLASSSAEVDGEEFTRAVGTAAATVEWRSWVLTATQDVRQLFSDESILNSEGTVVKTDDGRRSHTRVDLSYDLDAFAITATYMNGRKPPAFTPTRSTSLGITFKF